MPAKSVNAEVTILRRQMLATPDGKYLIATGNRLNMWNARTGRQIKSLPVQKRPVSIAVSPDGQFLFVSSLQNAEDFYSYFRTRIWSFAKQRYVHTVTTEASRIVAISLRGNSFVMFGGSHGYVSLWNLKSNKLARMLGGTWDLQDLHFMPDGRRLATLSRTKGVFLIDSKAGSNTRQRRQPVPNHSHFSPVSLAVSPNGRVLAIGAESRSVNNRSSESQVGSSPLRVVLLWDVTKRRYIRKITLRPGFEAVNTRFSLNHRYLAINDGRNVTLVSTRRWARVRTIKAHRYGLSSFEALCFVPGSGKLALLGVGTNKVILV
jgi:WD40 repeat protein